MKNSEQIYQEDIYILSEKIKKSDKKYKTLFPIPRGGYYPAIMLSNILDIPISLEINEHTLIVDDICDSGSTLSQYSDNDAAVVYSKEKSPKTAFVGVVKNGWIDIFDEKQTGIEDNIRRVFEYIGENPNRAGLAGTPDRMARMYKEIFRGYDPNQKPKITVFPNNEDGITYSNMVVDEGNFYSMCEHHMLPFFGKYWFAYIPHPKGRIIGISKVGRVVDYCSARMQIQERLVHDIVSMIEKALSEKCEYPPLGIALVMEGEHLCKTMRGVKKKGVMISSCLTGLFKEEMAVRNEFMNLIKK